MIELIELSKTFPGSANQAVSGVSFKINQGEIACIIGTSGCGKTTTLKMINRLVEPTRGNVLVNGQDFRSVDAVAWRRAIGYVVQKAGLLPHLTIAQNISLLSKIIKRPVAAIKARVVELMEMIQLSYEEYAHLYPVQLSGGQQQRVGIARALMEDPSVLLMDEPFGALDPITRRDLHGSFLDLNQKLNKTILMVTHDIEEAFFLSSKVIVMDQGKVIQIGSPRELQDNPKNQFVRDLIASK